MKVTANLATFSARKDIINNTIESLLPQVDKVRIWANDYKPSIEDPKIEIWGGEDLSDNGKFMPLTWITKPEIYFTVDDDIIYPKDYVETNLFHLQQRPGEVITHHGRKLVGLNKSYYHGHPVHRCNRGAEPGYLDVAGTGVSVFISSLFDFDPRTWGDKHMSDLYFSRECAIKGIDIYAPGHEIGWIKAHPNPPKAIYNRFSSDSSRQDDLANEICYIKGIE